MKNKLSIYLLKNEILKIESIEKIKKEDLFEDPDKIEILEKIDDSGIVYYKPSTIVEPSWVRNFFLQKETDMLQSSSRAVLIKRVLVNNETLYFALTFGYARFLFKPNVFVEQFGLKIVLNTIEKNRIRKISKTSIGGNQKQSEEQLPKSSDIIEFGFDINRDLMKNVTGKSEDSIFENSMLTGGENLSLSVDRNIENINDLLTYCYRKFKSDSYLEKFAWIDNIQYIKDTSLTQKLDAQLVSEINKKNYTNVWMAVPEVISWEEVKGFNLSNNNDLFDDIEIEIVVNSLKQKLEGIEQLKSKKIKAISNKSDDEIKYEWRAYDCIIAEITFENAEYCLNNGKWYLISKDFTKEINQEYDNLSICQADFIEYNHDGEDEYNKKLSLHLQGAIMFHKILVPTGRAGETIEPCDVYWDKKIIHVKKNSGSSMLSHLFSQAFVSSKMWIDKKMREKLCSKLKEKGSLFIDFNPQDYEIVLAIIGESENGRPKIPFFSKVTLCYTAKDLVDYGYKVSVKAIPDKKEKDKKKNRF